MDVLEFGYINLEAMKMSYSWKIQFKSVWMVRLIIIGLKRIVYFQILYTVQWTADYTSSCREEVSKFDLYEIRSDRVRRSTIGVELFKKLSSFAGVIM